MRSSTALIIGAGPASYAAGIFLGRAGISNTIIGRPEDSGLWRANDVQNYPGFPDGIAGSVLLGVFAHQAEKWRVNLFETEALAIKKTDRGFAVSAGKELYLGKYLILAGGRKLLSSGLIDSLSLKMKDQALIFDPATGQTSLDRVYAAGNIGSNKANQITVSVGQGTLAAVDIITKEKAVSVYTDHT